MPLFFSSKCVRCESQSGSSEEPLCRKPHKTHGHPGSSHCRHLEALMTFLTRQWSIWPLAFVMSLQRVRQQQVGPTADRLMNEICWRATLEQSRFFMNNQHYFDIWLWVSGLLSGLDIHRPEGRLCHMVHSGHAGSLYSRWSAVGFSLPENQNLLLNYFMNRYFA